MGEISETERVRCDIHNDFMEEMYPEMMKEANGAADPFEINVFRDKLASRCAREALRRVLDMEEEICARIDAAFLKANSRKS